MIKRRRRRRQPVIREERAGGTEQTLAKLMPDPLETLLDSEVVRESRCGRAALEEAADEIRAVYTAVTRMVMSKMASFGATGGGSQMPDHLAWAHAQTYIPWTTQWRHARILEGVIDIVVDRYQCPPASREWIVVALADYAKRMRERPRQECAA